MPEVASEIGKAATDTEAERLAALRSTGILDTEPEPSYDAIVRLAAEYFQAGSVGIGFADESRVWIKSSYGPYVRELPRKNSIFERVLAEDGPVFVSNLSTLTQINESILLPRLVEAVSFASVPVRSSEGRILGSMTIFFREPRNAMGLDELRMLESLADMVASQLELRRLRRTHSTHNLRRPRLSGSAVIADRKSVV